jgi:hypothetical protein
LITEKEIERQVWHKGELWEQTWFVVYLTKTEADAIFLDQAQLQAGWMLDQNNPTHELQWKHPDGRDYYNHLRFDLDNWLRTEVGPREGEVWEINRFYHPNEELPAIPGRGRAGWKEVTRCWPDEYAGIDHYQYERWNVGKYLNTERKGIRAMGRFQDEHIAVEFARRVRMWEVWSKVIS